MRLHKVVIFGAKLLSPLISLSQFASPLMIILGGTRAERSRTSGSLINRVIFTAATLMQRRTTGMGIDQGRRDFKGLLDSLDYIVCMAFGVEPTDNLIL